MDQLEKSNELTKDWQNNELRGQHKKKSEDLKIVSTTNIYLGILFEVLTEILKAIF